MRRLSAMGCYPTRRCGDGAGRKKRRRTSAGAIASILFSGLVFRFAQNEFLFGAVLDSLAGVGDVLAKAIGRMAAHAGADSKGQEA